MGYCTVAQVRTRNSNLLKNTDSDTIEDAIEYADGIIDGMIGERYPVPLSSTPGLIKGISMDLSASVVLADSVGNRGANDEPTQAEILRKRAMDLLERIKSGELSLNISSSVSKPNVMVMSSTYSKTPKFRDWNPSDVSTYEDDD